MKDRLINLGEKLNKLPLFLFILVLSLSPYIVIDKVYLFKQKSIAEIIKYIFNDADVTNLTLFILIIGVISLSLVLYAIVYKLIVTKDNIYKAFIIIGVIITLVFLYLLLKPLLKLAIAMLLVGIVIFFIITGLFEEN